MSGFLDKKTVRGGIGCVGLGTTVLAVALLATIVVQIITGAQQDVAGAVGASVCMMMTAAIGGAMGWYGYRGMFGEQPVPADFEDQLLDLADRENGRVTVAMVAADTDLSMQRAEALLTRLTEQGLVRMEVGADGDYVHIFPGLGDDEETTFDQSQFERELERARLEAEKTGGMEW